MSNIKYMPRKRKPHSEETKEKIRVALTNKKKSLKHRENMRRSFIGKHSGKHNGNWHGGRKKCLGYWYIWKPDHPHCDKKGCIPEHRDVYEESRDCILLPWISIHHIDGNSLNNIWYNLRPVTRIEHNRIHKHRRRKPSS